MIKKAGFINYLKRAFLQHWNLLIFGGGAVAGFISGQADIVLPLVAAGELVYLAGLSTHPKFQAYVDAQSHREAQGQVDGGMLQRLFNMLDPRSRARFEELRHRFRNLQALAQGLRSTSVVSGVESMQNEGINRLLWVFLKLLYSKQSLERFLSRTDEPKINQSVKEIELKIEKLGPAEEDTEVETKMRKTLEDTLQSARLRLENLAKAKQNYEFILLELDRIDSKITSIAEMAVNRQDPGFITSEVDGVSATMEQTEKTMNELQFLTGLGESDIAPPTLIDEKLEIQ
jgi:hypothetical protein